MRLRTGFAVAILVGLVLPSAMLAQAAKKKKTIVVAADGSGQFKTVQEAVDSAPDGNVRINIKPGEYRNPITIGANGVELRGLGKTPEDVVLVYDNSAGTPGPDGRQLGTGRSVAPGGLCVTAAALHVTGDREVFRKVRFLGFQDTLYADSKLCHAPGTPGISHPNEQVRSSGTPICHAARLYYADCYIEGHVDFIFGDAKAVFDRCEIHTLPHVMDTLTAQSRLRPEEDSGYVFRDCTVTGDPGSQDILLGRPWRAYSTVVFLNTDFKAPLDPAGWKEWSGALATSDYEEYNSHGMAGDVTKRIAPSKQITAADIAKYATKTWLAGTDGWDPEKIR